MRNVFLQELQDSLFEEQRKRYSWLTALATVPDTESKSEQRRKLIAKLKKSGVHSANRNSTLFTGKRSPNCVRCHKGGLGPCTPLTYECNRRCFFCYRYENRDYVLRHDFDALASFIKKVGYKGVAITGGEPLLRFDELCDYLGKLKPLNLHTHLYTNGVLLNEKKLKTLYGLGLNEVRFNLAASKYRLLPIVEKATNILQTVSVEIPAIPEDLKDVKLLLLKLDQLKNIHVNLNELVVHPQNINLFKRRGYLLKGEAEIIVHDEASSPIYGSEEMVLKLLEFAVARLRNANVHYCSYRAKALFQQTKQRIRAANELKLPTETISEHGMIERLIIYEPNISQAIEGLRKRHVSKREYMTTKDNDGRRILYVSPKHLKILKPKYYDIGVISFHPYFPDEPMQISIIDK